MVKKSDKFKQYPDEEPEYYVYRLPHQVTGCTKRPCSKPIDRQRHLTDQQLKVQQLATIAQVCLKKEASPDEESLFKCVLNEAERHLNVI